MRLLIAVPTFENIKPETFKSIYDMDKSGCECDFEYVKGYDCAAARNRIAKKAIEGGYDYCLMVDSDMVIPSDALTLMLECNAGIVLGFYQRRNAKRGETPIFIQPGKVYYKHDLKDLAPFVYARYGGFGCALVNVDVFKAMQFPYFQYVWDSEVNLVSEDIYFCKKARDMGIRAMAATRVWCGHVIANVDNGE